MKKSMKQKVASQLIEGIQRGVLTVDREGTVMQGDKEIKSKTSKYILKRMARMGARLNARGFYEVEMNDEK